MSEKLPPGSGQDLRGVRQPDLMRADRHDDHQSLWKALRYRKRAPRYQGYPVWHGVGRGPRQHAGPAGSAVLSECVPLQDNKESHSKGRAFGGRSRRAKPLAGFGAEPHPYSPQTTPTQLKLPNQLPSEHPTRKRRHRRPRQQQQPPQWLAIHDQVHPDPQHHSPDQAAHDPGADAKPDDFVAFDHRPTQPFSSCRIGIR